MNTKTVKIIGAGLAGCEAAAVLSSLGIKVLLVECKPIAMSPAHKIGDFAELVCSNSLKSNDVNTASGLLKQELRILGSPLIAAADASAVPAGGALAVDRTIFSQIITKKINNDSNIQIVNKLAADYNKNEPTIIASGPLTMPPLMSFLEKELGDCLHFFDAAAPIISADSIDYNCTFSASRYGKGEGEYINCPLTKDEYENFIKELVSAECAIKHEFEKGDIFEGCMPIEQMAMRGADTLRFGPLKPVGLYDENGKRPYAVIQLRRENTEGSMYNLVGFQTNLKFGEQQRVFGLIPALRKAEFLRYGVMHRNSFVNAPKVLNSDFSLKTNPIVFIAGQLSGVEGYCESIMSGHVAALSMYQKLMDCSYKDEYCGYNNVLNNLTSTKDDCDDSSAEDKTKNVDAIIRLSKGLSVDGFADLSLVNQIKRHHKSLSFPKQTMCGAITAYITAPNDNFQPINANFGLLPILETKIKDKQQRKAAMSQIALHSMEIFKKENLTD